MAVSFILQVAVIGLTHQYRTRTQDDHFAFGWEMGRIARSIAQGHGFSSPYEGNTGPTAWEPPLYPYLMAGVFKIFGIYTYTSAWVLLSLNGLFAALTCIPIYFIGVRAFDRRVAIWSAGVWALLPYIWYWSVHWIWDTTFTPLILSLIFLLALHLANMNLASTDLPDPIWRGRSRRRGSQVSEWILFGVLWGIAALANPSALSFLPFCGLWIWWRRSRINLPSIAGVVLASLVFFAALSPWLIRNYDVFGRFVFLRDDFGLQFRLGNSNGADGMLMAYFQPNMSKLELEKFQRMGELAYAAECKRIAFDWIRENPKRFAIVSLKRFFYYWNGVPKAAGSVSPVDFRTSLFLASSLIAIWGLIRAIRQTRPGASLFAGLILSYPTTYYFVFPHARYRHPIEPELLILAVFLLTEAKNRVSPFRRCQSASKV